MEEAAVLLGRPHQVRGPVVHGDGRGGAELGFPTANVAFPAGSPARRRASTPDGTSAGRLALARGGVGRHAAPPSTATTADLLVEAFLLDFDGDLYGEAARVSFVARLRDELRFDSVDELVAQMDRDVDATRESLAGP